MRRSRLLRFVAWSVLGICAPVATARAEDAPTRPPLDVVVAPEFPMETGIISIMSLGRLAFRYEELLPLGAARPSRDQAPHWVLDRVAWLGKTILVDIPLAGLQALTIHEAFGHGARARELGFDVGYSFKLPFPYDALLSPKDEGHAGLTNYIGGAPRADDPQQLFASGGIEANVATARALSRQIVAEDGVAHHGELALYVMSKLSYSGELTAPSFRAAGPPTPSSNDAKAYLSNLQERFGRVRSDDRATIGKRLAAAYLWNLADPMLLWAAWAEIHDVILSSQRFATAPLPRAFGATFLPLPRVWLAPYGMENELSVTVKKGEWVVDVHGRVGTTGLAPSWGGGASIEDHHVDRRVRVGAQVDVWRQPALDLERHAYFDRPSQLGGALSATLRLRVLSGAGLLGKLGAKTDGYLPTQPADAGPYGWVGLYLAP